MRALMNIICISIEQTDTKLLTQIWLDRLERYVKLLLIVSENWRSKNEQHYNQVQKRIAEAISFAFAFLFHEVNNIGTPKSHQNTNTNNSPQEKVQRGKLFSQALKNLLIFLVNVVHYSNQMMHPNQMTSMMNRQQTAPNNAASNLTSSRLLLQTILVKEYQAA